jgi:hypothetical protein
VIRFNCPNCNRHHEVHEALAKLPLICKTCGRRIAVPPPGSAPPPPAPPAAPAAARPVPPPPVPVAAPARPAPAAPKPPPPDEDDDVLITRPDSSPDIDFNVGGPTAASLSDAARTRPGGLSDAGRAAPEGRPGPVSAAEIHLDLPVPPAPPPEPPRAEPEPAALEPPEPAFAQKPAPEGTPPEPEAKVERSLLPLVADLVAFAVLVAAGILAGELLTGKPTGRVVSAAAPPRKPDRSTHFDRATDFSPVRKNRIAGAAPPAVSCPWR